MALQRLAASARRPRRPTRAGLSPSTASRSRPSRSVYVRLWRTPSSTDARSTSLTPAARRHWRWRTYGNSRRSGYGPKADVRRAEEEQAGNRNTGARRGDGLQLVHQALGMDPTQRVLADVEL